MLNFFSRRPDVRSLAGSLERHNVAPEVRDGLAAFLAQAPDRELYHFNPRALAERLGLGERAALQLLLAALHEGLVTLNWDVRCPMCGSTGHRGDSLSSLRHDDQCGVCTARFAARLDDEVRVTFSVHPRLRSLPASADDLAYRQGVDARLGVVPGHALLLMPDFQRLFPQQRLLPDESLSVARVALLFTDLAGSTAIYARRGDPRAYHLVRLHFDELFRVANDQGGLMVKTIGDAVMAAFATPREALAAAIAMQRAVADLNGRNNLSDDERLILKVGLHAGPCLSVTLNERPDYFGTAVNLAARVQGVSKGGDIMLTEAIHDDAEAAALLGGRARERSAVQLKGIDGDVVVYRIVVVEG